MRRCSSESRIPIVARVQLTSAWTGPSLEEIAQRLEDGDPGIRVRVSQIDDSFSFIPVNVRDGEEEIVATRLREILTQGG